MSTRVSTPAQAIRVEALTDAEPLWTRLSFHLALIFLLALVSRLLHLGDPPWIDEFYHILAARSWLEDGTLQVVEGGPDYVRTALYTYLVAGVISLLGDGLETARLPAVLFGALWITAFFTWTWWVAGRLAAWIAGGWFALDAGSVVLAQFVRFYTLHGLLFFLAVATVYLLVVRRPEPRVAIPLAIGAAACLALADYFQPITRIGLVALATWLLLMAIPAAVRWVRGAPGRQAVLAAGALAAAGALGAFLFREQLAEAWSRYGSAATWASGDADNVYYYYNWFLWRYPTFWALLPAAIVVGLMRRTIPTLFCALMFLVPFVLHSFAAFKSERFLFYAIPFFFALWAIVLAEALPWLYARAKEVVSAAWATVAGGWTAGAGSPEAGRGGRRARRVVEQAASGFLMLGVLGFLAYNNHGFYMGFRTLVPAEAGRPYTQADWREAAPTLRELAEESDVLLTTAYTKALYYLDRFDIGLGFDMVDNDGDPVGEFGPERVTARPAISTAESMEAVLSCHRSGLVIVDWGHWTNEFVVQPEVARFLEAHAESVEVPGGRRLRVFRWQNEETWAADRCAHVRPPPAGAVSAVP